MRKRKVLRTRMDERGGQSRMKMALAHVGHDRGLLLVGLFKLSKAIFFSALGAGALHLRNKDIGSVVMKIVDTLRIDPERHFVGILMDHVGLINSHDLKRAGILSFLYAAVCVVEGTGLVLEKRWAEYFTVTLTTLGLPWECYELAKQFSLYKVGLMVVNVVVLLYVLWILRKKRDGEAGRREAKG